MNNLELCVKCGEYEDENGMYKNLKDGICLNCRCEVCESSIDVKSVSYGAMSMNVCPDCK